MTFSRTGDPDMGEFGEAKVIVVYGAVDVGMLAGLSGPFNYPPALVQCSIPLSMRQHMFFPCFTTAMLAIESNGVIGLRLMKMAAGGSGAMREAQLMISEKVDAAIEASTGLMLGGSPAAMVDRYREHVAANSYRLTHG